MVRTKTKPFLKRKKVPKFYFHFGQQKKCPPFSFNIYLAMWKYNCEPLWLLVFISTFNNCLIILIPSVWLGRTNRTVMTNLLVLPKAISSCPEALTFYLFWFGFMVFSDNISAISWRSVLLCGGNRSTPRKLPTCRKSLTLSHNVVSSTPYHERDLNSQLKWW